LRRQHTPYLERDRHALLEDLLPEICDALNLRRDVGELDGIGAQALRLERLLRVAQLRKDTLERRAVRGENRVHLLVLRVGEIELAEEKRQHHAATRSAAPEGTSASARTRKRGAGRKYRGEDHRRRE